MNNPRFRPPAEAESLILQIDCGCPHNRCTFCGMYRDVGYQRRSMGEVAKLIGQEARRWPEASRIFLADGDVMCRTFDELRELLVLIGKHFSQLRRINTYANGRSIARKSEEELGELRALRLHTLYLGMETGDDDLLRVCRKGETAAGMVEAGKRAQAAGLRLSVMVLLGLGGCSGSSKHARRTAEALNGLQPRLLSALRVVPVPGTELQEDVAAGRFHPLSEHGVVSELRDLVARLDLDGCVFRANHSSNVVPLEARLPRDRERLLDALDLLLASGQLDPDSPGPMPFSL